MKGVLLAVLLACLLTSIAPSPAMSQTPASMTAEVQ